ncbi:MAG: hypothetical protein GX922_01205 [Firmicutes bacterium]|nr:hypothetical protein [Bacillota bacterium]
MESLIIFLVFAVISVLRTAAEQQSKQTKKTPGTTRTERPVPMPGLPRWLTEGAPAGRKARPAMVGTPNLQQDKTAEIVSRPVLSRREPELHEQENTLTASVPLQVKIEPAASKIQLQQNSLFHNLDEVRRGIVLAEILGKPKALRKYR